MSLESVPVALTSSQDLFDLWLAFGGFSDLVVISAECRTGGKLVRGATSRDDPGTARIVLGSQWEKERYLVLHLTGLIRMDIRFFGVYGGVEDHLDEEGFRFEFPDGAVIASEGVSYEFISY